MKEAMTPTMMSGHLSSKPLMTNTNSFVHRKHHPKTQEIINAPCVKWQDLPDRDDKSKYNWIVVGTTKYGRDMWCTKTKIKRTQNMGEVYGGNIVD